MNTILLRLMGPMQSWGVQSRFGVRDTGLEPSKSGVVGLLCAALGRGRNEPLNDLAGLVMGVRIDREGRLSRDYHTAQHVLKAGGGIKETELSIRYYLAEAAFLVGFVSEDLGLLQHLQAALLRPIWPLYLGRKAFIPAEPVGLEDGLKVNTPLQEALQAYPYLLDEEPAGRLRGVLEDTQGEQVRPDQPISFAAGERHFAPRRVRTVFFEPPARISLPALNSEEEP